MKVNELVMNIWMYVNELLMNIWMEWKWIFQKFVLIRSRRENLLREL